MSDVGEKLRRSTVQIRTGARGAGSGIILRPSGMILTNAHVVGPSRAGLTVELWDGRTMPAVVTASDAARDLATVQVAGAAGLPVLKFRATEAKAGEPVIAIGNPWGFAGAMSKGVARGIGPVTRLGRRSWLQAAIRLAPGNSGGPLADADGRVLGINTMVMGDGVSLAVPAASALDYLRLGATPRLGISVREVSGGLVVLGIAPQSPAEQASLLMGDVLTHWNGVGLQSAEDLTELLREPREDRARVRFTRGGTPGSREVTLVLPARRRKEPGLAA